MVDYIAFKAGKKAFFEMKKLLISEFNVIKWFKLSLIVFIVGLSLGGNRIDFSLDDEYDFQDISFSYSSIIYMVISLGFFVFLWVISKYLSSIFHFIFLESVEGKYIEIKEGFRLFRDKGRSLFIFRVLVCFSAVFFGFTPLVLSFVIHVKLGNLMLSLFLFFISFCVLLLVLAVTFFISVFTSDFAVPLMVQDDNYVFDAWRKILFQIRKDRKDFLVYFLTRFVLGVFFLVLQVFVSGVLITVFSVAFKNFGLTLSLDFINLLRTYSLMSPIDIFLVLFSFLGIVFTMLVVSFLISLVFLPVSVFFRLYSVIFIQHMSGFKPVSQPVMSKVPDFIKFTQD